MGRNKRFRGSVFKRNQHGDLTYGDDTNDVPYGVRGVLAFQRRRPLFSGVRTQVLEMHRIADTLWGRVRKAWMGKNPWAAKKYGEERAGQMRPLSEVTSKHLPKMMRFKVYGDQTKTLKSLTTSKPL